MKWTPTKVKTGKTMKELILLTTSVIGFITFFAVIAIKFGILKSISASDYEFKSMWAFTIFTWWCSVPLIFAGILGPFTNLQRLLVTFSGIFWMLVGAAPSSKNIDVEKPIHNIGASGAGFTAYSFSLLVAIKVPYLWFVVAPSLVIITYMYLKKTKNHTWWIETIAYVANILVLYLFLS